MGHVKDTNQLWDEMERIESICNRWETFFGSLVGEPQRATSLCTLGMLVVSGHAQLASQSGGGEWLSFFRSLVGKTQLAKELCAIGLEMVLTGSAHDQEEFLTQVRRATMRPQFRQSLR
jgi:hypothetical protein